MYRIKLVMDAGPDAHYWYADDFSGAAEIRRTLLAEVPAEFKPSVYVYVETSLGHVRVL